MMAPYREGKANGNGKGLPVRKTFLAPLVVACVLCLLLAVLWLSARAKRDELARNCGFLTNMVNRRGHEEENSWRIMCSHGLFGRTVRVAVGDAKYLEFRGADRWEAYAQLAGPADVGLLPADLEKRPERVVVSVDGAEIFNAVLDIRNGWHLVVEGTKQGYSLQQTKGIVEE